jgi:hypothetical protein
LHTPLQVIESTRSCISLMKRRLPQGMEDGPCLSCRSL